MPFFSIITVNLNNKKGLEQTINSVISQISAPLDFEFIVIDGASSDGSLEVIEKYRSKITKYISEPDEGIYDAMNKGLAIASGEFINFLNSGDYFYSNNVLGKIKSQVQPDTQIIWGNTYYSGKNYNCQTNFNANEPVSALSLSYWGSINHQAIFARKELFHNDKFDTRYKYLADYKFLFKKIIIDSANVQRTDDIIVVFDTSGVSNNKKNFYTMEQEKSAIREEFLPKKVSDDYAIFQKFVLFPQYYKYFKKIIYTKNIFIFAYSVLAITFLFFKKILKK